MFPLAVPAGLAAVAGPRTAWQLDRVGGGASSHLVAALVAVGMRVITRIRSPLLGPLTEHRAAQPFAIS